MSNEIRPVFNGSLNVGAQSFGAGSQASGHVVMAPTDTTTVTPRQLNRGGDVGGLRDTTSALIVVVANVERDAVMQAVKAVNGHSFTRYMSTHHTVYSLGRVSRTEVLLSQIGPGAVTPDAASTASTALIADFQPDYVILVGICYGLKDDDPKRPQRLADVLVADQLRLIAHKKVSQRARGASFTFQRGGEVHPSPNLLDRLRSAQLDWNNDASVHFGPMLTESVLVDSFTYRQQLKESEREAIGGEMEAGGIYTAATRSKVDWAMVKGICDWGYDKTDAYQAAAAANAASFVVHMIQIGGLDPIVKLDSERV